MAVAKAAVVGVDIGAADTIVAYVAKGAVDIVQNEVSQRTTPSLVAYKDNTRLLGDPALATIKSNLKNTCRQFQTIIGRKMDDPIVQEEQFWQLAPIVEVDGRAGYRVNFKGEDYEVSAEKVMAAYLDKVRQITESWCKAKLSDIVCSVPGYLTDAQRQAWLDACAIAGISCLRLMHEHAAVALSYGIYRSNDFDAEKASNVLFVNVGHAHVSAFAVSFVKGKLTVLSETNTTKVSGRNLDLILMKYFSEKFQKKVGADPMSNLKAKFKLEDAVRKTKATLSANAEAPISVECLMEDEDLGGLISRQEFEELCQDMVPVLKQVVADAIEQSGIPKHEFASVEVSGGVARTPWIKATISEVTGFETLSTTMNMDECVARGCALQAAILSPLYKVRDFQVLDYPKFPININWTSDAGAADDDVEMEGAEAGKKTSAPLFTPATSIPTYKNVSFKRKGPFTVTMDYAETEKLPPSTDSCVGRFEIALPAGDAPKKVKVRTSLNYHGMTTFDKAELAEEEEYEETVKEKKEIPQDETEEKDVDMKDAKEGESGAEEAKAGTESESEAKGEPKKKEPKYEWVEVKKTKKRTKITDLEVTRNGVVGMSVADLQVATDAETKIRAEMKEIEETENARNDLETYIYNMRDKCSETGTYGPYMLAADRDAFQSELVTAEDWLYDNFDATKVQYVEKTSELQAKGEPAANRYKGEEERADYEVEFKKTIAHYRQLQSEDKYSHIAAEKKQTILDQCAQAEGWIESKKAEQAALAKHVDPVFTVPDMRQRQQDISAHAEKILSEPKPAPPVEKAEKEAPTADPKGAETADAPPTAEEPAAPEDGSLDVD
jgi:heat shock protein 4